MGSERGGPVEGKRSISGRSCLPLAVAMMFGAVLLVAALARVAMAVLS